MPLDKAQAMKYFNNFFQNDRIGRSLEPTKRVALCAPSVGGRGPYLAAISGTFHTPAVGDRVLSAFQAMLNKHGVEKRAFHDPINCAEAHLWLELMRLRQSPRNLDVYVAKKGKNNPRAKRDSPCPNCQQWARLEFRTLNTV